MSVVVFQTFRPRRNLELWQIVDYLNNVSIFALGSFAKNASGTISISCKGLSRARIPDCVDDFVM